MVPATHIRMAAAIIQSARSRGWKIAVAESCTGGLISAALTEVAGSSEAFTHGFITYANAAKCQMIGVPEALLREHGAVSEAVARAMAEGALATAHADITVAVTGIAGPGGATAGKPVGLVHLASSRKGMSTLHQQQIFSGDRRTVREQSAAAALELLQQQFAR